MYNGTLLLSNKIIENINEQHGYETQNETFVCKDVKEVLMLVFKTFYPDGVIREYNLKTKLIYDEDEVDNNKYDVVIEANKLIDLISTGEYLFVGGIGATDEKDPLFEKI